MAKMPPRYRSYWTAIICLICLGLEACSSAPMPGRETSVADTRPNPLLAERIECLPPRTEYEDVVVAFALGESPPWKLGYFVEYPPRYRISEFIREGDSIKNWRELFTVQSFNPAGWGGPSPEHAFNGIKALQEQKCPGRTQWNVIENRWDSILFEWQAKPCEGWPEQHEIAKIVYGKYNRFYLHYVAKVYQLPPETRTKWIKMFAEAKTVLRCR